MNSVRRLITSFVPQHYDLSLSFNREERMFDGISEMSGEAIDATIYVHAKDIAVTKIYVDEHEVSFRLNEHDEIAINEGAVSPGKHVVKMIFNGVITDSMHGIYPSKYTFDGASHELIATQFESHHAREAFPCIDEPEAKATFDVRLTTEKNITVLGNMPVKRQSNDSSCLVTEFERTPRMSSYLVAWVFGNLHRATRQTKSGVEVNIWATPAQPKSSLEFALDIATRTIDFFDEYFGVAYPLPKSDHVALPDFSSGAMENWGLITYREVALLAEPGSVSISSKHRIAAVIAHELSHQWFGNLVTMKWWNNLWLNESFANLMEYIAVDALEPDWNVWLDFSSYESVIALRRDAIDGVQPVQVDVSHPDEISTLFDPAIVYAKGSRLIRMLERYIGTDAFRNGLQLYFKQHAYGNTSEIDLWDAFSQTSGQDIAALMTPWISQPGYPVVKISEQGLMQSQFFIGERVEKSRSWPIPLNSSDPSMPKLLTTPYDGNIAPSIRLNTDDSAHFITQYDKTHFDSLLSDIQKSIVSPIQRLQLLNEQSLLARGGLVSSETLIPLVEQLKHEQNESVWDLLAMTLGELRKFVEGDEISEKGLRVLSGAIASEQYQRLGWMQSNREPEADTKLRATAIGLTLYSQDEQAINHAQQLYESGITTIDPELRATVISSVVRHGSVDVFNELLDLYRTTSAAELQQDICAGLTSTKNSACIDKLLTVIMQPEVVRAQDVARWFAYLMRNKYARAQTWQWMQDNWHWIESTFGGDKSFDDYPRYSASGLMTQNELTEYDSFFAPLKNQVSLKRVIEMGHSEIAARVQLIEKDGLAVRNRLVKYVE